MTALADSGYATITAETTDGSNLSVKYYVYARGETKKITLSGVSGSTIKLSQYDSETYCVSCKAKGSGYASYQLQVFVNKPGLTAGYDSTACALYVKANKKGTYKVTISCQDGSKYKKTYTVKVK